MLIKPKSFLQHYGFTFAKQFRKYGFYALYCYKSVI